MLNGCKYRVAYVHLEHPHREYDGVVRALAERDVQVDLVHINDIARSDPSVYDMINVRMCRGFHLDPRFMDKVEALNAELQALHGKKVSLVNSLDLIRGALDKQVYLRRLEEDGVRLIPSRWVQRGERVTLDEIMDSMGWDDIVVKPTVSSRSWNTFRVTTGRAVHTKEFTYYRTSEAKESSTYETLFQQILTQNDACVQRFMPRIVTDGETSFVFLGGEFSHAVHKAVNVDGGWFAHELLGGTNRLKRAGAAELAWADSVYRKLEIRYGRLVFARIDGILDNEGDLQLLECELVIPRLLLAEGAAFGRYADTIVRHLNSH